MVSLMDTDNKLGDVPETDRKRSYTLQGQGFPGTTVILQVGTKVADRHKSNSVPPVTPRIVAPTPVRGSNVPEDVKPASLNRTTVPL